VQTTLGTARHFHPPGTPGIWCQEHNRSVLAAAVAAVAQRDGYGMDLTDEQIDACVAQAKDTVPKRAPSAATRAAVRSALRPALSREDGAQAIAEAVLAAVPDSPIRVRSDDGREFYLVPVPAAT